MKWNEAKLNTVDSFTRSNSCVFEHLFVCLCCVWKTFLIAVVLLPCIVMRDTICCCHFPFHWMAFLCTLSECSLEIRKLMCAIFQPVDAICISFSLFNVYRFACSCLYMCVWVHSTHMYCERNQLYFNCLPLKQSSERLATTHSLLYFVHLFTHCAYCFR